MTHTFKSILAAAFWAICWSLSAQSYTLETVPDPKAGPSWNYVSNPDNILSAIATARINTLLKEVEDSTTAQVAVVVLTSIGDAVPKDFAHDLFTKWGLGYAQKDNGLLLLFIRDQRRLEFETGYGLEGVLPDISCARIQREYMFPAFKNGDYDAGMTAGVEAVSKILLHPESAQEIVADRMLPGKIDFDKMDFDTLLVLALIWSVILTLLRIIRFLVRYANSVKKQIDTHINQKKGHLLNGFLFYWAIPIGLAAILGYFSDSIYISFGDALIGCYAYLAFLIWDSRSRRETAFAELYEKMPENDQYIRFKAATGYYGIDALLFPIPGIFLWFQRNKRLRYMRTHPRNSPEGHPLQLLSADEGKAFLTPYQQVENELKTIEYDVWRNEAYQITQIIPYESLAQSKYSRCTKCNSKAYQLVDTKIIVQPTTSSKGQGERHYQCKACGNTGVHAYELPKIPRSSSGNGSGWSATSSGSSWSSGSSSGGSSWGGGRSGGGGAGGSW